MVTMENSEEILQILERFTQLKQKEIPQELEEYLQYVAKTGDTIFKWSSLKYLFREKLLNVIKHFNEDTQRLEEIPNYPNVDPFNYETMKSSLLERLDLFNAAPFTVQRLCELLIDPRKQYSRIDKFMRALEKNILVVSTIDPGRKRTESENGDSLDSVGNGDLSLEVNIDIEMENENMFNNGDERNGSTEDNTSGALKASCPRTDDVAVQPKAKKAKLDFDESDQPEEANAEDADEDVIKSKSKADQPNAETADAVNAADEKAEKTDAVREVPEIEEPDEEEEEVVPDPKAKKSFNSDKELKETPETAADIPTVAEPDEADSDAADAVKDIVAECQEKEPLTNADEQEQATKIVEKQELESGEKVDKPAKETETEKKIEEADVDAAKEKKEPTSEKPKPKAAENAKKPAKTTSPEKASDSAAVVDKATTPDKDEAIEANASDAEAKTDIQLEPKAAAEGSNTEKTESEATPATAAAAEPAATAATASAVGDKEELTKTATASAALAKTADAAEAASPIETDELATPQSPTAADATATPAAEEESFAVSATPALTLNDQPMEDTPAEEEDAQVSPIAGVEEVVMAESGVATGDMATDEATKDEPAAMEVDDTSQEVMDQ
ncbi:serine/threonine-protein phosphatase 4 regulatory subunit 2 [Drosophila virilis]|uniref:Uncharacterized protein, isoform A n=1 Tax=Drosophila virilis TaxID=7244 RepID=B4M7S7_DROVI|nr:serine/threonine-protein phosphatase 4 regulatory subunit 2 [Drosophila virilis]XP_015025706.1 serine/threonine-protein phosphatase 4 regulatory subunit 2 [Drosophila virilis]EDW62844.1 uncharacterized protein Dvir_GJ17045, isoform A [Drosophila virilis]KRF80815.1 uncharacterized protein Dvir_GJ17045, isoform B [Drosophila virilis]